MEFFIEQISLILPVLGLDFTQSTPTPLAAKEPLPGNSENLFEMAAVGIKAEALEADGEFVVLKGSQARTNGNASWTSYKGLRDRLLKEGKLVGSGQPNILVFAENVPFESPSAAAAVVYAGNQNGRMAWRAKATGQTYKDWQESQIATANATGSNQ
jgi:hypothetical protein